MLEKILDLAKNYVQENVTKSADIPENKKDSVSQSIMNAIQKNVQQAAGSKFDLNSLMGLLGNGNNSDFYKNTESSIVSALTGKSGLSTALAGTIASSILPGLIKSITSKFGGGGNNIVGELLGKLGI